MPDRWDSSLYDDRHSFVWKNGGDLIDLLELEPGERVLDLGCGTGHIAAVIADHGAEVVGIDSSPSMIAPARSRTADALLSPRQTRFTQKCMP